jgi:hypothetical protein
LPRAEGRGHRVLGRNEQKVCTTGKLVDTAARPRPAAGCRSARHQRREG